MNSKLVTVLSILTLTVALSASAGAQNATKNDVEGVSDDITDRIDEAQEENVVWFQTIDETIDEGITQLDEQGKAHAVQADDHTAAIINEVRLVGSQVEGVNSTVLLIAANQETAHKYDVAIVVLLSVNLAIMLAFAGVKLAPHAKAKLKQLSERREANLIDRLQCSATKDGNRCPLFQGHVGDHLPQTEDSEETDSPAVPSQKKLKAPQVTFDPFED